MAGVHKMAAVILFLNALLFVNCHRDDASDASSDSTSSEHADFTAVPDRTRNGRRSQKKEWQYEGLPIDIPKRRADPPTTTTTTTPTTTSKDNSVPPHVPTSSSTKINIYPKPTTIARSTIFFIDIPDDPLNPDPAVKNVAPKQFAKSKKTTPKQLSTSVQTSVKGPANFSAIPNVDISDITEEVTTIKLKDKPKKKSLINKKNKMLMKKRKNKKYYDLTGTPKYSRPMSTTIKSIASKNSKIRANNSVTNLTGISSSSTSYFYMKPTTQGMGKGIPQIAVSIGTYTTGAYTQPQSDDKSHVIKLNNLNDVLNFFKLAANLRKIQVATAVYPPLNPRFRRIYNPDERASIDEYPFLAAVLVNKELWCGGVIIDRDRVLTAAHCLQLQYNNRFFREYVKMLTVRVGSTNATAGGEVLKVVGITFHPNYKPSTLEFNAAVLQLHKNLTFETREPYFVTKTPYARENAIAVDNTVVFLGWGSVLGGGGTGGSVLLQKVELPVYDFSDCQQIYGKVLLTRTNFCAGYITLPKNVCNHDAGGPAILDGVLVGILSYSSKRCDQPDQPAVFTSVGALSPWLDDLNEPKPRLKTV